MLKIPLKAVPNQEFKVVLDNQNCSIHIYYRFGNMFLDLICNDTVIQTGAICRNRAAIIQVATNLFKGNLHFIDLLGEKDPVYTGFSDRYSLLYVADGEDLPKGLMY
jgi:hypothetical protein